MSTIKNVAKWGALAVFAIFAIIGAAILDVIDAVEIRARRAK